MSISIIAETIVTLTITVLSIIVTLFTAIAARRAHSAAQSGSIDLPVSVTFVAKERRFLIPRQSWLRVGLLIGFVTAISLVLRPLDLLPAAQPSTSLRSETSDAELTISNLGRHLRDDDDFLVTLYLRLPLLKGICKLRGSEHAVLLDPSADVAPVGPINSDMSLCSGVAQWNLAPRRAGSHVLAAYVINPNGKFVSPPLALNVDIEHGLSIDIILPALVSLIVAVIGLWPSKDK